MGRWMSGQKYALFVKSAYLRRIIVLTAGGGWGYELLAEYAIAMRRQGVVYEEVSGYRLLLPRARLEDWLRRLDRLEDAGNQLAFPCEKRIGPTRVNADERRFI